MSVMHFTSNNHELPTSETFRPKYFDLQIKQDLKAEATFIVPSQIHPVKYIF